MCRRWRRGCSRIVCAVRAGAAGVHTGRARAVVALTWPGNLAELQIVVERAAADAAQDAIQIEDVLPALKLDTLERLEKAPARFVPSGNLRDARLRFERDYIAGVLQHHGWRMGEAAQALGIQRPNLYRKARQLGIPLVRASE